MEKCKNFLDTVHGYISIPVKYCDKIIDTNTFQRLRRIEQTSARSLFPCARHDRFIHSLGVYHIGSKIFKHIQENFENNETNENKKVDWKSLKVTYEVACLLHDCGHAPFSHTFEKYYDKPPILTEKLIEFADDEEFAEDIEQQLEAAPHERLSAILVLQVFRKAISELGGNSLEVVRMIIGCNYLNVGNDEHKRLVNCFISLLHGRVIDADRLDYVCRDKWASGYSSNSVDLERLIQSMFLIKNENDYTICYNKSALNEIQSVIDVKDFQQQWVINHHKVVYEQYILDKAIEKLAMLMTSEDNKEIALSKLFNYMSYLEPISVGNHKIYMPCDDDLVHLLKQYLDQNEFAREWFERQHRLIPLWKSQAEFVSYFCDITSPDHLKEKGWLYKHSQKLVNKFLVSHGEHNDDFLYKEATPKIKVIGNNEVMIWINDKQVCYTSLNLPKKSSPMDFFFYLYIPKTLKNNKKELITLLQNKLRYMN